VAALVIHAGKRQRKLAQAARQVTLMPHSVGAHTRNHENIAALSACRRGAYNRIALVLLGGFDAKLGLERRIGGKFGRAGRNMIVLEDEGGEVGGLGGR
jgi:hypothetical protein